MTFSCLLKKRQTLVIKAIFARVCVCVRVGIMKNHVKAYREEP